MSDEDNRRFYSYLLGYKGVEGKVNMDQKDKKAILIPFGVRRPFLLKLRRRGWRRTRQ